MFDVKKFVAFMAFNDKIRNRFFDIVELKGIDSRWDTFHVLADEENISDKEVLIMRELYEYEIQGNSKIEDIYNHAIENFRKNLRNKIKTTLKKG